MSLEAMRAREMHTSTTDSVNELSDSREPDLADPGDRRVAAIFLPADMREPRRGQPAPIGGSYPQAAEGKAGVRQGGKWLSGGKQGGSVEIMIS